MPNAFFGSDIFSSGGNMAIGFQATISAATAGTNEIHNPHHPITCQSEIGFDEDGIFSCEHCSVPADDARTKRCLVHSMAILIVELAYAFEGIDPDTGLAILRDVKEVHAP